MKQLQGILILFAFISVYPQQDTSLILSEIMFIPQPGNNEFIELYNASSTDTINLNGFKIKYYTASGDVITSAGWGTLLPPLSYAVILEGDYDFTSGIYNAIIPMEALKLKISDNAFGATGMSNTSDRPVLFLSLADSLLDYRFYTADNTAGYSEEKIVLNKDSLDSNWDNCQILNGTPGKRNSVCPLNYDLCLFAISITPPVPAAGEDVFINACIKNRGRETAIQFSVSFYNDVNFDSLPQPSEKFSDEVLYNLLPVDSVNSLAQLLSPAAGSYNIIAEIFFGQDEDTLNNSGSKAFTVYEGSDISDIVFNELMYAPSGGMPEWVELYNRSDSTVNLRNRKISDNSSSVYITRQNIYLPPDSFVILSEDSSILDFYSFTSRLIVLPSLPSLNNTGDDIIIRDSAGIHFDSLSYLPEWGGTSGKSLERISSEAPTNNSNNWGTTESIYKGTPGMVNSITSKENDLQLASLETEKPYGIIGEEIKITAVIKNKGTLLSGSWVMKLYKDINEDSVAQTSELLDSLTGGPILSGDSVLLLFRLNEFTEGFNYLIASVVNFPDEDPSNNTCFKRFTGVLINELRNDLVINEFMYAPSSSEPEWIELYNRSNKIIQLKNYLAADARDTVKFNNDSLLLYPEDYIIISSDSSISGLYQITSKILVASLPSLNNTGDNIIIMDSLGRAIDSLAYTGGWGAQGKSCERISAEGISTDSSNWKECSSRYKGTPGYINSATPKQYDIRLVRTGCIPSYPVKGDNVKFTALVKNCGSSLALFNLNLYSDTNLDSLPDALLETINGIQLSSGDSSSFTFNYTLQNLDNYYNFFITSEFSADQDTSNDYSCILVFPGYAPGSVVINEIMYSPGGGEPEWIEFYNRMNIPAEITEWELWDIYTTPSGTDIKEELFIQPGRYYIVSKDSSISEFHRVIPSGFTVSDLPVLNNDRDGFVLKDNRGQTIDSLIYDNSWGGISGHSLERISPEASSVSPFNWRSSDDIEQSTPGRINNKAAKQFDLAVSDIKFSPRFPVKHDDVTIYASIKNFGRNTASGGSVLFFSGDSLIASVPLPDIAPEDSLVISAPSEIDKIDHLYSIRIRVLFNSDEDPYNNEFERSVQPGIAANEMIVTEIMYEPADGEPDWIEIQNISEDSLNIVDWTVEDISSGTRNNISFEDVYIQSGEYFILTSDSSFKYYFPEVSSRIFTLNNVSLGNNGDGIILYDFRGGIIDSITYKPAWGGDNGYSLERISKEKPSYDSSNWTSCLHPEKSTPGRDNSMWQIRNYNWNEIIVNEILADPDIDNCEFLEFLNLSSDSINIGGWRIEDEKGTFSKLSGHSCIIPPGKFIIKAADSIIFSKYGLTPSDMICIPEHSLGLTNTGELLLLKDINGNVIDSLFYSDKWHNKSAGVTKNISLERISPLISSSDKSNWSSSVSPAGATPGRENSIYCINPNTYGSITAAPNPFSPDNDGFEDHCIINYKLKSSSSTLRLRIFDSQGREVRTVLNGTPSAGTGSVIFDGCNDSGEPLRIGIYIIYLEASDGISSSPEVLKTIVVVARKL